MGQRLHWDLVVYLQVLSNRLGGLHVGFRLSYGLIISDGHCLIGVSVTVMDVTIS